MTDLAPKAIPDSPRRMGRLPLEENASDTKPTPIRFGKDLLARIDGARGSKPRAAFVRDLVVEGLDREEKEKR